MHAAARTGKRTGTLDGKLRRAYLGKSADLTLERLKAAAVTLAGTPPITADEQTLAPQPGAPATAGPGDPAPHTMPVHLLATKLFMPRLRPDIVVRPRLRARLDAGLDGLLTLVSAPAGFGKTTLLSDWIQHALPGRRAVAWLSLDAGDNDPLQFLRYLVAAIQTIAPAVGGSVLALLQSPQPPPLPTLLPLLLNELHPEGTRLPPSVLVLDDYQVLQSAVIHEMLAFLLDHLPPQLHLVIATRADPPLPFARLRARRQLSELRAADLRFTCEEAATFLSEVMDIDLSAGELAALEARTEGWIAALHLAALSMQGRENISDFIAAFTGSHHHMVDYLITDVLQRQAEPVQTFLLRTAILDRLCASLCDAVVGNSGTVEPGDPEAEGQPKAAAVASVLTPTTGYPPSTLPLRSQAMLEYLECANLLVIPLDDERRWYRYHHLFADFLRSRLRQTQPEHVAALHQRAAGWLARQGLVAEAVSHALAGEDFEQTADLVEHHAEALWLRGEVATVEGWIAALPPAVVRTRPRLCLVHAWMLFLTGQIAAVEPRLHDAERALRDAAPWSEGAAAGASPLGEAHNELHGMLATVRASLASLRNDAPRAIALAREALAHLPEESAHWRSQSSISLGIALDVSGDVRGAIQAFEEAAAISQRAGNTFQTITALWSLAARQIMQGRLRAAETTYRRALRFAAERGQGRPPALARTHIGLGDLLRERNELAAAERHVREGLELARQGGNFGTLLDGYMSLARVLQAQGAGDPPGAAAREALRPAEELVSNTNSLPLYVVWVEAARARLWLAQGNLVDAVDWAQHYGRRAPAAQAMPGTHLENVTLLTLARVYIAQRDAGIADALALLERLLDRAESEGRTGTVIEALALQALALAGCGDSARAISVLQRALTLAAPEGYVRLFVDEGVPMAELLQQVPEQSAAAGYARKLLAAFPRPEGRGPGTTPREHLAADEHMADTPVLAPPSASLVEPLSPRELEVLRLLAAGASNREIGDRLVISAGTVKAHLHRIYGKLNVHNRTEAAAWARALGLL